MIDDVEITLSCESATRDAVGYFFQARVHVEHFGGRGLVEVRAKSNGKLLEEC